MKTQTFAQYINSSLRWHRLILSIVLSLLLGFLFGLGALVFKIKSDQKYLEVVAPHMASLVEIQDGAELQRLLYSLGKELNTNLTLVQNGIVSTTNNSISIINEPFQPKKTHIRVFGSSIGKDFIQSERNIKRSNGPNLNTVIISESSLSSIVDLVIGVIIGMFFLGLIVNQIFATVISRKIAKALNPIKELDEGIRSIKDLDDETKLLPTHISELETFRYSIINTRRALIDARDRIALLKAKELSNETYKQFIHDLQTPISALRQMIKISQNDNDEAAALEAHASIPKIAEQILNQVIVAKNNLKVEPELFKIEDLRLCLSDAIEEAKLSSAKGHKINISTNLPNEPVLLPYDFSLLKRAISNLIINAMDFCKSTIEVGIEKNERNISIKITDDGNGLREEDVSVHLQGRGQSREGSRPSYGLASANHIARSHGGRIIAKNLNQGGACFEIRL